MELLQLKYFSHAAKTENFSRTAQRFEVPASCVSMSIKKLETDLGVRLFDRTANRIKLNEYGKILLRAIDQSEALFKKAKADILDLSQTPSGEVRLLIQSNRQRVTEVISDFKKQHPKVSFYIKHEFETDPSGMGEYDIVVTDREIPTNQFDRVFWLREEICLAVHKSNPLFQKNAVAVEEVRHEKFICLPKGSSLRNCTDAFFEKNGLEPEIVIECDDPQYVRSYLKLGLGVTLFPAVSWKDHISGDIKLLRIQEQLHRTSYIYTNKAASHHARAFSELLEK